MKALYLFAIVILSASCSQNNQEKAQTETLNEIKVVNDESIAGQKVLEHNAKNKASSQINITCLDENVTEWYGFDETVIEPVCQSVSKLKIASLQCELSPHAFGVDFDAFKFEGGDLRFFVYPTLSQCEEAMDIRNSNGP